MELRSYQKEAVDRIVRDKKVLLCDPVGTGKTAVAINSVLASASQPALVVCPAILRENWRREILMWDPNAKVQVIKKKSDLVERGMEWYVVSYDMLDAKTPEFQTMGLGHCIFDEAAALKSMKAKRTRAARDVSLGVDRRLLMTATPIMNRPAELGSLLGVMGELYKFGGWNGFVSRYCDPKKRKLWGTNRVIWDITGASNLQELHTKIQPLMIRRTKEELLPELPTVQFIPVWVDLENRIDYDRAQADVKKWLIEKHLASEADSVEKAMAIASAQALAQNGAEAVVRLTETRKLAVAGKVGPGLQWIKQWREDNPGAKLIVFGSFREPLYTLVHHLNDDGKGSIPRHDGQTGGPMGCSCKSPESWEDSDVALPMPMRNSEERRGSESPEDARQIDWMYEVQKASSSNSRTGGNSMVQPMGERQDEGKEERPSIRPEVVGGDGDSKGVSTARNPDLQHQEQVRTEQSITGQDHPEAGLREGQRADRELQGKRHQAQCKFGRTEAAYNKFGKAAIITGSTPSELRQIAIDRFQNDPSLEVIICSIKAAGVGLTLTAADTCLFLEETWTPSDTEQAVGRLNRIGQLSGQVLAYQLMGNNSVDGYVRGALEEKRALIGKVLDG